MSASSSTPAEQNAVRPAAKDSAAILAQLERIVESPAFRNSRRYPRFLRFVVEQVLCGQADSLKERLVGIEVFNRSPDYDLATDPIVRVAAGEVRKRLAQYYVEEGHDDELRIQLQPGSYVPEFHWPRSGVASDSASSPPLVANVSPPPISGDSPSLRTHRIRMILAMAALGVAVSLCGIFLFVRRSPILQFWGPFLDSANSPLICLGDGGHSLPVGFSEGPGLRTGLNSYDHLALGDVEALNRISTILAERGKAASVSNSRSTTFAELRRQPLILIGGSPNQWTMRYMQLLRYQLVANFRPGVNGILDRENASQLRWEVDFNVPYSTILKEYAIVARFHNPATGQPTVIAAGVGANGQVAAAEFLTTPAYLKEFIEHAPQGWEARNIEIILETQMINGDNGPPHVVTTYIW